MASVNPLSRELVFKIVYYGPGLGGKTTTLEHIHATAKPDHRGKLVSLATPVDRTLYFDFLPMRLPPIRGMHVRLQLFTVPGQVYFNATRKLVLTGADGVVFVADAQTARADANQESLDNLRDNLADQGRNLNDVPIVFQYNKYDLPDVLSVEELDKLLNRWKAPSLATSARTGLGVYEGLERITHAVLSSFETQMPESVRVAAAASFDPNEEGLAAALRGASQGEDRSPTSGAIINRVASSRVAIGSIPPETGIDDAAPPVDKVAMRAAGLPVTTFPEVSDDGWGSKEKLGIAPASEGSILTRGEGTRSHTSRSPESRSGESPRSRNRPSVLPPKPFAPLIPQAGPPRAPVVHAPIAPTNATITTKDHTPAPPAVHAPSAPANATITAKDHTPAPPAVHAPSAPANATTSAPREQAHAPAPPPNATKAAPKAATSDVALADRAPSTERTIAVPVKPPTPAQTPTKAEPVASKVEVVAAKPEPAAAKAAVVPAKPEPPKPEVSAPITEKPAQRAAEVPAAKPFERLDPTQLLSIADLLEPPPEVTPAPAATTAQPTAKQAAAAIPALADVAPPPAPPAPAKRVPAEPEPAPKVAAPPPAELQPLPLPSRTEPAAAKSTVEEAAKEQSTAARPAPEPVKAEAAPPAPPPPPPARPIGSVHVAPEAKPADTHVATPLTSKDSATTDTAPLQEAAEKAEPRKGTGLSFAELWPESDRALVHDVEAAIAAGRCSEAIELADTLVTRILTSTATLFGSADAARDAASMPQLLGLDGRRFLSFRSLVRASRSGAKASVQDALAAYAFALEARMAKSSVR